MDIASQPPTTTLQSPLLERALIECANRLGAIGMLALAAGLGAAYTSKDPSGGGSKVLAIAMVPTLVALAASLWVNTLRHHRAERPLRGVLVFNLVLMTLIVVALIADQIGYIAELSASVKSWMETPNEPLRRRRPR